MLKTSPSNTRQRSDKLTWTEFAVDSNWFPKAKFEEPGAFVPICREVVRELCRLDERFCHLGRKVKRAENAAELPLNVLERSYKRGQQILSLASVYSPLDTSIYFSGSPGASVIDRTGRGYIALGEEMSCETDRLRLYMQVLIEGFAADEARIWTASERWEQSLGACVWLKWKRDPDAPPTTPHFVPRGEPSSEEPWLGGTLWTWPENDPRKVYVEEHERKADQSAAP